LGIGNRQRAPRRETDAVPFGAGIHLSVDLARLTPMECIAAENRTNRLRAQRCDDTF
jgi:hypothetical protein